MVNELSFKEKVECEGQVAETAGEVLPWILSNLYKGKSGQRW